MDNKKKITIEDVALALGVSKTTVSRAISGKGRVGEATRNRVLLYIQENGYVPNAIAKSLASSRTYNIGLSMPEEYSLIDLPFFQKCMMGICEYAGNNDYDVVITKTGADDVSQLARMVDNKKVDGVIISRTLIKDAPVELLKEKGIPFVTIGSSNDQEVIQIDNDHESACAMLTSILFKQGIEKIALLCGDSTHVVTNSRCRGFVKALREAGVKEPEEYVFKETTGNYLEKVVNEILDKEYDCILCMDDSICLRVLDILKNEGVEIPKDIKVASFYNSSTLERNTPSITSLKFDAKELGITAAKVLIDVINEREVSKKTLLGYEISMKESTRI